VKNTKAKLFTSPNRFSVLAKHNDADEKTTSNEILNCNTDVTPKPLYNVNNISDFVSDFMSILKAEDFVYKSTPSYVFFRAHFHEHYNLLLSLIKAFIIIIIINYLSLMNIVPVFIPISQMLFTRYGLLFEISTQPHHMMT
jgi:hypothetical protein